MTAYRAHVDAALITLLRSASSEQLDVLLPIVEIGMHHEQQHQELLLTDILHAFAQNPTDPVYNSTWQPPARRAAAIMRIFPSGIRSIGFEGDGFCFDNEQPAHQVLLREARIARNLVTNGEWLEFMADGGYRTPSLWLSDGWAMVEARRLERAGLLAQHRRPWSR